MAPLRQAMDTYGGSLLRFVSCSYVNELWLVLRLVDSLCTSFVGASFVVSRSMSSREYMSELYQVTLVGGRFGDYLFRATT